MSFKSDLKKCGVPEEIIEKLEKEDFKTLAELRVLSVPELMGLGLQRGTACRILAGQAQAKPSTTEIRLVTNKPEDLIDTDLITSLRSTRSAADPIAREYVRRFGNIVLVDSDGRLAPADDVLSYIHECQGVDSAHVPDTWGISGQYVKTTTQGLFQRERFKCPLTGTLTSNPASPCYGMKKENLLFLQWLKTEAKYSYLISGNPMEVVRNITEGELSGAWKPALSVFERAKQEDSSLVSRLEAEAKYRPLGK